MLRRQTVKWQRFIKLIPIKNQKDEELATTVLNFLNKCNIGIKNSRRQSYDNALIMSGCYKGLKAHINRRNQLAPCAVHSCNLVRVCALENRVDFFFGFVQALTTFFQYQLIVSGLCLNTSKKAKVVNVHHWF